MSSYMSGTYHVLPNGATPSYACHVDWLTAYRFHRLADIRQTQSRVGVAQHPSHSGTL